MFSLLISMTMIITGTLITLTSPSWPQAWLGSESNLLGFLPMVKNKNNPLSNETTMKYFLIQTISSSLLILSFLPNSLYFLHQILNTLSMIAILIKLASAPFHFWLFPMIESLSWNTTSSLLTWQKLAPLYLITLTHSSTSFLIILLNGCTGTIMMINQNSIKKLLGYSSIAHLAWILTNQMINSDMMLIYFFIYMFSTISTSSLLMKNNMNYLSQTQKMNTQFKNLLLLNSLSLMGFPPLLGFFPKMLTISQTMSNPTLIFLMILLTYFSLLASFSYSRSSIYPLMNPISKPHLTPLIPLSTTIIPLLSLPLIITF